MRGLSVCWKGHGKELLMRASFWSDENVLELAADVPLNVLQYIL